MAQAQAAARLGEALGEALGAVRPNDLQRLQRLVTRLVAIVPAAVVAALWGEAGIGKLLVLSQVILSLQLPFAVFPLVQFTSSRAKLGPLAARGWVKWGAWGCAVAIALLNVVLLWQVATGAGASTDAAAGTPPVPAAKG